MKKVVEAYRYCQWLTNSHYENFPVASWLLPREKRPAIAAIYAFARSADDFSDEAKYRGRSLELLDAWRTTLWAACGQEAVGRRQSAVSRSSSFTLHPIFIALADAIRRCDLPVQLLDDLLTAFTMDVTKRRYADWEELMTYCRYSANPVGRLVLTVFGYPDPELHRLSDQICTALQLANHWQDLSIDFGEKDRLYVPQDLMQRFGVTEEDLKAALPDGSSDGHGACRGAARPDLWATSWVGARHPASGGHSHRQVPHNHFLNIEALLAAAGRPPRATRGLGRSLELIQEIVHRTRRLFDAGEPLLQKVSGPLRLELSLTLLGGRAILDRIEAAGCDVFRHRPVLSAGAKLRLLTHALLS